MGGRFRGRITGIMVCAVVALCARQGLHGHPDGVSVAINFAADEPNGAR